MGKQKRNNHRKKIVDSAAKIAERRGPILSDDYDKLQAQKTLPRYAVDENGEMVEFVLPEILIGKVVQFEHGWGFIEAEGYRFFVHHSDIVNCGRSNGYKLLKVGWEVEFTWYLESRGYRAQKVSLIPIERLPEVLIGEVISFGNNFGFIEAQQGYQFYVHYSSITSSHVGYKYLEVESKVSFRWQKTARGLEAIRVVSLEEENAMEDTERTVSFRDPQKTPQSYY